MLRFLIIFILIICLFIITNVVQADEEEDLAKQTQNPVADLISVPFQNNTNFNLGPNNRTQNILNIQPVIPFNMTENWNLITRTFGIQIFDYDLASGHPSLSSTS